MRNKVINVPHDSASNLPIISTESNFKNYVESFNSSHSHADEELENLSNVQRKLLRWHRILGHVGFHNTQAMARNVLKPKEIANCLIPECGSCQLGKQQRNYVSTNGGGSSIKKDKVNPRDLTHSNQFSSSQPGLVPQSSGRLLQRSFHYGTICIDPASDYVAFVLQETKEGNSRWKTQVRRILSNPQCWHQKLSR